MSNIIVVNKEYLDKNSLEDVFSYIAGTYDLYNANSITNYCGGYGINVLNLNTGIESFRLIKRLYQQEDKNQLHHFCLTLCKNDYLGIPIKLDDDSMRIWLNLLTSEVGTYFYQKGFQVFFGVHENTDIFHVHFVLNSVNYRTGNRIFNQKGLFNELLYILRREFKPWDWEGIIYAK